MAAASLSDVEIANQALSKLGENSIESLTQSNSRASAVNQVYEKLKRAELRRHTWGFAKRRASLPASTTQTAWGSLNRFPVPSDFLRLLRDDETGMQKDWTLESDNTGTLFIITADSAPLQIKYIANVDTPPLFDDLFVEMLASKIAWEICEKITGSTAKRQLAERDYDTARAEAMRVHAIETRPLEFPEDTWEAARR